MNAKLHLVTSRDPAEKVPVVHRTFDPGEVNPILNDPTVFPLISLPGQSAMDATELLADARNVAIATEGGVILFTPDPDWASGIYNVHTNFKGDCRGEYALGASLAAYRWMFTHTECLHLQTMVPVFNRGADAFCRRVGASFAFVIKGLWPRPGEPPCDVRFYYLSVHDWLRKHGGPLIEVGRAFHKRLHEEYARHAFCPKAHPDEAAHDMQVGFCVETIYGGEPEKAIILYNRWARFAGYGQISLKAKNPLLIDLGESLLEVANGSFKVIKCRPQP